LTFPIYLGGKATVNKRYCEQGGYGQNEGEGYRQEITHKMDDLTRAGAVFLNRPQNAAQRKHQRQGNRRKDKDPEDLAKYVSVNDKKHDLQ